MPQKQSVLKLSSAICFLCMCVLCKPAVADESLTAADELIKLFTPADTSAVRGIAGVRTGEVANQEPRKSFLNVLFAIDSSTITEASYPQLDEIGKALSAIMQAHPAAGFIIEGHTDSTGATLHNQYLSLKRARSIKDYLHRRYQLDEDRITAIGYGEERPVASNDTENGKRLNRRVEIVGS